MGTRALVVFLDRDRFDAEQEIAVLYRHYDGYLEGLGQELCDLLHGWRIVNGFKVGDRAFNGMGDLAVRVITALKGDPEQTGQYYLKPAGTRDVGEYYVYFVSVRGGGHGVHFRVEENGVELYSGEVPKTLTSSALREGGGKNP